MERDLLQYYRYSPNVNPTHSPTTPTMVSMPEAELKEKHQVNGKKKELKSKAPLRIEHHSSDISDEQSLDSLSPPPSPPHSPTLFQAKGLTNGHRYSQEDAYNHRPPSSQSRRSSSSSRKSPTSATAPHHATNGYNGSRIVEEMTVVCEMCSHPNNIDPTPAEEHRKPKSRSSADSSSSENDEGRGGGVQRPDYLFNGKPSSINSSFHQPQPLHSYTKQAERRKTYSYEGLYPMKAVDGSSESSYADEGPISIVIPPLIAPTSPMVTTTSSGGRISYPPLPLQQALHAGGNGEAASTSSSSPYKLRQKSSQSTLYPRVVPSLSPRSSDGVATATAASPGSSRCKVIVLGNSGRLQQCC